MTTKEQSEAVKRLQKDMNEENLWNCIVLFGGYQFYTASGLPFSYQLKVGRKGSYTKELIVDRKAGSKSLVFSSIRSALQAAIDMQGEVVNRPKALGDIRGISYIYPLLYAFGVIDVPDKMKEFMVKI